MKSSQIKFKKESFLEMLRYQACLDEAESFTPGLAQIDERELRLPEESQRKVVEERRYSSCVTESENYTE